MNNPHPNLRLAQQLRDTLAYGTLEQCLAISMSCHALECAGHDLSLTEERLWAKLTDKIERLREGANDAFYS